MSGLIAYLKPLIFLFLISFNNIFSQMSIVWEQQTNTTSYYNSRAERIAYDSEGNIIIGGYSWYGVYNSNQTVFVMKISPDGNIVWLQRFMGEGVGDYDNGTVNGLFIDSEDNILLFAKYFSQKVIKYDKDGNLISAEDHTFELPITINVYNNSYLFDTVHKDAGGYFNIGGIITDYNNTYSYYAQFNPQLVLWDSKVESIFSTTFNFGSSAITYYDSYHIYMIGGCAQGGYPATARGMFLSSMAMSGEVEWTTPKWYTEYSRYPVKMLRANDGSTYLANSWESSSGHERGSYLTKLGTDGAELWEVSVENMYITDIAFDNGGNIWVTGQASNSYPNGNATVLLKYSAAGERIVDNLNEGHYWIGQLLVDENNDVYLYEINSDGIFIVKYQWNGDKLDEVKVSTNWNAIPTILELDEHNDLISCIDFNETIWIKKITDGATGIEEDNEINYSFILSQNYPNPFNPSTKIKFSIPESNFIKLAVFDVLGNQLATLMEEYKNEGVYEITFDGSMLSSGIYFYRLEAGNYRDIKKMILVK